MGSIQAAVIFTICIFYMASATNSTDEPVMPLSFFKSSGLYDAIRANTSDRYFDLFISNYRSTGIRTIVPTSTKEGMDKIGSTRIGDLERSSLATTLPHASCNPYEQVITIPNDKPNVLLYPSCVMLKQCGGCCGHPSLMCKPTMTKDKTVQVTKYVYDGQQAHPVERVDFIQVKEHTACECQCKITEADCNPALHDFDDWDCECQCKNELKSCPTGMRWDDNLCACRCSSIQNCGTGYTYNLVTCSCDAVNERSSGSTGTNTGGSATNQQPSVQENVVQEETVTKAEPCAHLRCPKRYKATNVSGSCRCKFARGKR